MNFSVYFYKNAGIDFIITFFMMNKRNYSFYLTKSNTIGIVII